MTEEILKGFANGAWRQQVEPVRRVPHGSDQQRAAKLELPFVTWSGEFAHRSSNGLIRHSGQIGIDVDDLAPKRCLKTISRAVLDPYCLAAFHSASGRGVRLLFRVPVLTAAQHKAVFRQVARHVRKTYHVEPDTGGSDVCRVSFVTYDKGLYVNRCADMLPVDLLVDVPAIRSKPRAYATTTKLPTVRTSATLSKSLTNTLQHLGASYVPVKLKPDGTTHLTHKPLLKLAWQLAVQHNKRWFGDADIERCLDAAAGGWFSAAVRKQRRLRGELAEYRLELGKKFHLALRHPKLVQAATKWTRCREHPEFPTDGTHAEQLMFAIRMHCKETGKAKFFISSRAAGIVIGRSHSWASKILRQLRADRVICIMGPRLRMRHASTYRLL